MAAPPSLDKLKQQAKTFRKNWRAGDPSTLARVRAAHPQFSGSSDEQLRAAAPRLTHCQLVLAREAGFASWTQLRASLSSSTEGAAARFVELACLCYDDPHFDHRSFHARARALLAGSPELVTDSIWAAAAAGNSVQVASLLDRDPTLVNRPGPHGWVPLICACYSRVQPLDPHGSTLRVAHVLLERGATAAATILKRNDPPGSDRRRRFTALTGVFGGGSTGPANQPPHPEWRELAELLLAHGAGVADEEALGIHQEAALPLLLAHGLSAEATIETPTGMITLLGRELGRAALTGNEELVRLLLAHRARLDEVWNGKTPWEHAFARGAFRVAELLEQAGAATVEVSAVERFTAVCLAGDEDGARALIERSPDLLERAPRSMVNQAVSTGRIDAVRLALDLGFDPNHLDEVTPLHQAVWKGWPELVELLLSRRGLLTIRDPFYDGTPVGWADFAAHERLRDHLLSTGPICLFDALDFGRLDRIPDILARDPAALNRTYAECLTRTPTPELAQTPIARMVERGDLGAVRALLEHGADLTRHSPDGRTLFALASEGGCAEIADLLRAQGTDLPPQERSDLESSG